MAHSTRYYIDKGFDPVYAEYFSRGRRQILDVKPGDDFTLMITFDNSEKRVFDMKPHLQPDTVFERLADEELFNTVYLDEDHVISWDIDPDIDSKIHWNNKIDISSDTCYVESKTIKQ